MSWLKKLIDFIRNVAEDKRIPPRDKKVVLVLLALVLSPFDIIPDWIPLLGVLDDIVIVAIVLDYFFNRLDQEVLLSHYPWGMKSYIAVRKTARMVAALTPAFITDRIWKYEGSIYKK